MRISGYSTLFALLLFISCSPEPVFRISPDTDQTTFYKGVEYIQYSNAGLILSMGYYRHSDNHFIMDVEMINENDSVIFVDPTQFRYSAYNHSRHAVSTGSDTYISSGRALDPELEMLELDLQMADLHASEETDQMLFLIGQGLSIVSEIAADSPEVKSELNEERHELSVEQSFEREEYRYSKMTLAERRKVWEMDAFRKTHLFHGDYIRGYIFFKNQPEAALYTIEAPELFNKFKATFIQQKYTP